MTNEQQKTFLIDLLKVMIRDLLVYRAFFESEKSQADLVRQAEIEEFVNSARMDAGVRTQLGHDFASFVDSLLEGSEGEAILVLDAFLREWTPRPLSN